MELAAYGRVSTNKDDQLDSLEHQKDFFSEYAKRNGHHLVQVYADEGISGKSLKKRDEFLRLMKDARLGLFEGVVVKDVSRFARNTVDFLQSIRELKALGINITFITANMESLGESEFVLTIFGAMAQEEIANLSKRVKFGKRINAQRGRVPQRIFGYDRIDNFHLRINEREAGIVRDIFSMYAEEGLGCRRISQRLNQEKRLTKFGCAWDSQGIRRILVNPIYCGHYINHKYEIESYLTGKQIRIPASEHFHHHRPEWAIISEEMFQKAQEQLSLRKEQYKSAPGGTRYSSRYLFSTLIKCEHCGRSFCRKRYEYRSARVYWKCTTNDQHTKDRCDNAVKVNESDLVGAIRAYLSSVIRDRETFVSKVLAEVERQAGAWEDSSIRARRAQSERRRKELLARKERYQEMYAGGVIALQELKDKAEGIRLELQELERGLKRDDRSAEIRRDINSFSGRLRAEIDSFLQLENMTNMDLRKIIDRILVNRDGSVRIIFRKAGES